VIEAVVTDFGGVLTAPLLSGFAAIQYEVGVGAEEFGRALARSGSTRGRNPLFELEVGAISEGEFLAALEHELTAELGRDVSLDRFGERYMAALAINAELLAYLRELHAGGTRLAICTNNVREWAPRWHALLPLDELFETVVDSSFVGVRKPDPAIYELVLYRLGLPAAACVFVDDLERNVDAARALGFAAVHFRDSAQAIGELRALLDASAAA
jgi:putative hydrolase of the HAD superfamily